MSNHKVRSPLRIFPAPFKSSFLSIPPSPFSPRTPLTPTLSMRQRDQKLDQQASIDYPKPAIEAPPSPLSWMWKCHRCHYTYHLGVTRRCLEDGHRFCSGATIIRSSQKPSNPRTSRKHRACTSEFDYSGWKAWGRWRRGGPRHNTMPYTGSASNSTNNARRKQDCWNMCNYPSECRWGKRFGIHTPVETVFPSVQVNSMPTLTEPINTTSRGILKPEECNKSKESRQGDKTTFWGELLASVERRKSAGERGASALSTATVHTEEHIDSPSGEPSSDSDIAMPTIDPALLANPSNSPLPTSSDTSSLTAQSPNALVSRRRYRRVKSRSKLDGTTGIRHAGPKFIALEPTAPSDQVSLNDADMQIQGFAPLHRVQSRGGGHHHHHQSCSV